MEVAEAPRLSGRFNLDSVAKEHMNEGLETWTPHEPVPSLRNLEAGQIRPLMDIALPGLTSISTSGIQTGTGTSRLKELQERLQSRALEISAREGQPSTWMEYPLRSVVISSNKKKTDGAYHRHNRENWTAAQRERRDAFRDAAWVEYFAQPRIPEGTVHLLFGDSLVRVLTRIQAHWQVGILSFSGAAMPQILASLELLEMRKMYTVTLMMGTNDVSRGESSKMMRLHDKVSCILEELRIYLDPAVLTICTVPYNMMYDQNARDMNERVRHINGIIRQIQQKSVLPVRLLEVARMMEDSLPEDSSSDGIHFDRPRGTEWLNGVFQKHINFLESDLVETGQFTFGPPPKPSFFPARSSRSRQLGSTPMERDEAEFSTSQSFVVSSVVGVANRKKTEGTGGTSRARYLERVKDLDLEDLACRQELAEVLGLKSLSHEDLNNYHCVDWLKTHEAHFSRAKTLETADLTGIPKKSIMGPVNYRPLKELGSPGLIVEPPKHGNSIARMRVAIAAQLRAVEKLLEPKKYGAS